MSASLSGMTLAPGVVAQHGAAAVSKALDRLAHLDSLDLALGPPRALPLPGLPAGLGGLPASWRPQQHQRSYGTAHVTQLLRALAAHGPGKKLPALFLYSEAVGSGGRPGVVSLQGPWRSSFVEVRLCTALCAPVIAAAATTRLVGY
jgi:hypothetical protein